MTFKYTVSLDDPNHLSQDAGLIADANAAAQEWSNVVYGLGSLDIQITVGSTTRAEGGPGAAYVSGTDGPLSTVAFGSDIELATGVDPNGTGSDIDITIDPTYLQQHVFVDPNPNSPSAIPRDRVGAIGDLAHEIGHGLGILGYRDDSNGALTTYESAWDRDTVINADGTADFVGPAARAVYGGPAPVTTVQNGEQYNHLGNVATDADASDLMNGLAFYTGQNYSVSNLDLAIVHDLGLSTYGNVDGDPLIDAISYLGNNPDVVAARADPQVHYDTYGWHEGRDPDALFSTNGYLNDNPDVKASGMNPLAHYEQYGWKEGRDPSAAFSTQLYLLDNPDVAAFGMDPLQHYVEYGQFEGRTALPAIGHGGEVGDFDPHYYLLANPDVAAAADTTSDPNQFAYQHFETFGWHEGRNPDAYFDTKAYLAGNKDVAASGMNPLTHYEQFGWHEGRDPSAAFDTAGYLAANPDVKAAGIDPLQHFLTYGAWEGRSA